jgi:predicted molibdopterin-dependent oxidoreductase YjgC
MIDGEAVEASEGDLLMTAILLHRPALRPFEFGDAQRAGFCFMAACQDCWVSLADGRRVRACSTLVEAGMAVLTDCRRG